MKKEDIIKEIAAKVKMDPQEIAEDKSFTEDLGLDSIDLVEVLMEIEEEHSIEISDDVAIEIKTVGDFIKAVEDEINE